MAGSVIVVTIPYVPGRDIARVAGIVIAEVVLGTGFFTEFIRTLQTCSEPGRPSLR